MIFFNIANESRMFCVLYSQISDTTSTNMIPSFGGTQSMCLQREKVALEDATINNDKAALHGSENKRQDGSPERPKQKEGL